MRKIKIFKFLNPAPLSSQFDEAQTKEAIMCAFNLDKNCVPNCAACTISGSSPKAFCNRGPKDDFCIGLIVE